MVTAILISTTTVLPAMASTEASNNISYLSAEEKHSQQETYVNTGFGTGFVIGAIVAGPIGAFVAGVTGTFIAKHINATTEVEQLNDKVSQLTVAHQEKLLSYKNKLQKSQQSYQAQIERLKHQVHLTDQIQAENLVMSLQFSTGSSQIAAHYQEQILALAQILNTSPMMKIDLSGYTDLAGDETVNHNLSLARVQSVKKLLLAQGVNEQQIATYAFGEESPVVANAQQEVSFYDRRVVLKLHHTSSQTAKR